MAFTKIEEGDLTNKGVVGLPDTPNLGTTDMQKKFDEIATDVIVPKHNGLIDELEASTAAASVGAVDANGNVSTVQAELNGIKQQGYTKAEADVLFAGKVDKEPGKGLSEFDFSQAYKDKLNGIEDNANNYVLPAGTQSTLGGVMGDGTTFTIDSNGVGHAVGGGGGGTSDYNALINKPQINGVELIGNKDSSEYGLLGPVITITSDAGSTVTIEKGTTVIPATQKGSTTWTAVPNDYGTWTVRSSLAGADDATTTVTVDAVKTYAVTVNHISATIAVTYPAGATSCTLSKGSTVYTATSNPQTFTVRSLGTWTVTVDYNGIVKTATATISADGDSQSVTVEYASIVVTYGTQFEGSTIICSDGTSTYTKTAPVGGSMVTFTIPNTGSWTISSVAGGQTYTQTAVVSSYTSYAVSLQVFNATITVTFPYSEGASCSITDGVTTLSANTSPMAFSIPNAGTWTATALLDGASKTGTAKTITTDGQTETDTIEYGEINLTYANEFRGQTITCTQSGTTITKAAPSGSNSMAFYPPTTGSWTISGTYSGTTYYAYATVSSLSTAVSALLQTIPDGSTATPTDVVQTWLACAGINDKAYTTVAQVLGDSTTLLALISDNNAVDYMVRSTTWASDVCADSTAMTDIGANDYCADTLLSDATWASAIANSTYFESVLNVKVPAMTSNTTPSGICGAEAGNASAYKAFNDPSFSKSITYEQNSTKSWNPGGSTTNNAILWYDFGTPQVIKCCEFRGEQYSTTGYTIKDYDILYSDDGSTWTVLTSGTNSYIGSNPIKVDLLSNDTAHRYWGFRPKNTSSGGVYVWVLNLQFYGRTTS